MVSPIQDICSPEKLPGACVLHCWHRSAAVPFVLSTVDFETPNLDRMVREDRHANMPGELMDRFVEGFELRKGISDGLVSARSLLGIPCRWRLLDQTPP